MAGHAVEEAGGRTEMSAFTEVEIAYLSEGHLGRIATVDETGQPHVVPVGYSYNAELDTIDIGGIDFANTRKFRNVKAHPKVALVVDDVRPGPGWSPRAVQVRGEAEALDRATPAGGGEPRPLIRITPAKVVSWNLDADG